MPDSGYFSQNYYGGKEFGELSLAPVTLCFRRKSFYEFYHGQEDSNN